MFLTHLIGVICHVLILPLQQIANDITQKTPASFEPSIDYIVTKIPKFAFEKFKGTKAELTTQVGPPALAALQLWHVRSPHT
jgi:hypothetical protein